MGAGFACPRGDRDRGLPGSTEITVEITTTFDCPSLRTGLLVGGSEALGPGPFAATKETCAARRVGELVVVPRKTADSTVYVRVLAGVDGTSLDVCQQDFASRPMGSKCIEAKRIARFLHHTRLRIPIVLSQSCINVMCGDRTCEDGQCVNPNVCMDPSCMDAGSVPPIDSGVPVAIAVIAIRLKLDAAIPGFVSLLFRVRGFNRPPCGQT
jgi:hypothetical protein